MKTLLFTSILLFFCTSCAPYYPPDPNASTIVTVQYENEPPRVILNSECRSQYDCGKKTGANCAAALYNESLKFLNEADGLADKKLYLSATLSTMQAMTRLSEAEITLKKAKTDNFEDWKVAVVMGLEKKIEEKLKLCQRKIDLYNWKR